MSTTPTPITEPVTVAFTVRERDGQTLTTLDSLSDLSVTGAYDAVRIRALANDANDAETVATMSNVIHAAKPRAIEAARTLAREAGKRQEEAFRPGGDRRTRDEAKAALKACLRAYRVSKA